MPHTQIPTDPNTTMVVVIGGAMAATAFVAHLITKAILDGRDEARATVHYKVVLDGNTMTADTFTDFMLSMLQEGMRQDEEHRKTYFGSGVVTLHQKSPEMRASMSVDRFLSVTKAKDLWEHP